eukprot:2142040-Prymnesium_polylepis.1
MMCDIVAGEASKGQGALGTTAPIVIPQEIGTLLDVDGAEHICCPTPGDVEGRTVVKWPIRCTVREAAVTDAGASEMLQWAWCVGSAKRFDCVHAEHVELLDTREVVKVGVRCLCRDLLGDADAQEGLKRLLLAHSARHIRHQVAILDQGAHHRTGDAFPPRIRLHRDGCRRGGWGMRWRAGWRGGRWRQRGWRQTGRHR